MRERTRTTAAVVGGAVVSVLTALSLGTVRWNHETNRGFLRGLEGLRAAAESIGEADEARRCDEFLYQLDPGWDRRPD